MSLLLAMITLSVSGHEIDEVAVPPHGVPAWASAPTTSFLTVLLRTCARPFDSTSTTSSKAEKIAESSISQNSKLGKSDGQGIQLHLRIDFTVRTHAALRLLITGFQLQAWVHTKRRPTERKSKTNFSQFQVSLSISSKMVW